MGRQSVDDEAIRLILFKNVASHQLPALKDMSLTLFFSSFVLADRMFKYIGIF